MKQKNSYINKQLVSLGLKNNLLSTLLYFGILLVLNVIPYILTIQDSDFLRSDRSFYNNHLIEAISYEFILLVMASIVITAVVFKGYFAKDSRILIHSMPITKSEVHRSLSLTAFILYSLPWLFNLLIMVAIASANQTGDVGFMLVMGCIIYLLGVFIVGLMVLSASLSGSTVMQILMAAGMIIVPFCMLVLIDWMLLECINGYIGLILLGDGFNELAIKVLDLAYNELANLLWSLLIVIIYMGLTITLGGFIARRRKNESQLWVNQPKVRVAVTVITAVVFGYIFAYFELFKVIKEVGMFYTVINSSIGLCVGFVIGIYLSYQTMYFYRYYRCFILSGVVLFGSMLLVVGIGRAIISHVPNVEDVDYIKVLAIPSTSNMDNIFYLVNDDLEYIEMQDIFIPFLSQSLSNQYVHMGYGTYEKEDNKRLILDTMKVINDNNLIEGEIVDLVLVYYMNNGHIKRRFYKDLILPPDTTVDHTFTVLRFTEEFILKNTINRYERLYATEVELVDRSGEKEIRYTVDKHEDVESLVEKVYSDVGAYSDEVALEDMFIQIKYIKGDMDLKGIAKLHGDWAEYISVDH